MELKNYQEDVVLSLIDILLEDEPEYLEDQYFKYDVAAFTLNRISPKYFMSERGFTRFADLYLADSDSPDSFANLVELSVVINQAIDTIKRRRSAHADAPENSEEAGTPTVDLFHNFPHIIGRVLDTRSHTPVPDAQVTLSSGGIPVDSASPGWPNPCRTTIQGKGYFSFWPKHMRSEASAVEHALSLQIGHESYEPFILDFVVSTQGEYEQQRIIRDGPIISLDACLLLAKT